jgi:hypothetical protein
MKELPSRPHLAAEAEFHSRRANEGTRLREGLLSPGSADGSRQENPPVQGSRLRARLVRLTRLLTPAKMRPELQSGAFRFPGKPHQWISDGCPLRLPSGQAWFPEVGRKTYLGSAKPCRGSCNLAREPDGSEWKPLSLFMEAS